MKTLALTLLYFITGIVYIALQQVVPFPVQMAIKALLMPILITILLVNREQVVRLPGLFMLAALLFSWAGDITIEFSFMAGLLFFLSAHIMYITLFIRTQGKNVIFGNLFYLLIPVFLYGLLLVAFMFRDLDGMRYPVIVYAAVILTMLAAAINRKEKVNSCSYRLVLAGAILFVFSDSAIAINRFSIPLKHPEWIIMTSYIAAQYMITIGYIKGKDPERMI